MTDLNLRLAKIDDVDPIAALIDRSVRGLQKDDYTPAQIDAALGSVFGVDRQLISDQTYFVVTAAGAIIACGGWSRRQTLFGGDAAIARNDAPLDPARDAARIRAFFVDPPYARQGLGSRLLEACEAAASACGFTRLELGATLTGAPLYARHGFLEVVHGAAALPDGSNLPIIYMAKVLGPH